MSYQLKNRTDLSFCGMNLSSFLMMIRATKESINATNGESIMPMAHANVPRNSILKA